jgi:lipopolysaccharide/colanic/teichoic acid biosynthesis glycosyltransferase
MGAGSDRTAWKPVLGNMRPRRRLGGIYEDHELQNLIMYEKARADRTGNELSVVLCNVTDLGGDKYAVGGVIREITTSVRTTDHVGWYDKSNLGVLLPLTSRGGAEQFVNNLHMNGSREYVSFRIYSYPTQWIENQNGDSDSRVTDRKNGSGNGPELNQAHHNEFKVISFTKQVPAWKRALDILGGTVGLIILLPFLLVIGIYIKLVSPGPVLFRQQRVGLARKEFTFYKFRTMHYHNNQAVHSHHAKDFIAFDRPMTKLDGVDPRIIKGGRILRKLALDELPQLLNIIKGDMSLVGPRPCIPYEADEYLQWHARRFSILPGLSGLWQVSGKNKLTFQQMIRLDIAYEEKMSFWFDVGIILRTFPTVVGLGLEGARRRIRLGQDKLAAASQLAEEETVVTIEQPEIRAAE